MHLQEGYEPELEDDLVWAEKMVKLIEQLGLASPDGKLAHSKLNSIWSNSLTNKCVFLIDASPNVYIDEEIFRDFLL